MKNEWEPINEKKMPVLIHFFMNAGAHVTSQTCSWIVTASSRPCKSLTGNRPERNVFLRIMLLLVHVPISALIQNMVQDDSQDFTRQYFHYVLLIAILLLHSVCSFNFELWNNYKDLNCSCVIKLVLCVFMYLLCIPQVLI